MSVISEEEHSVAAKFWPAQAVEMGTVIINGIVLNGCTEATSVKKSD
jgi:hypothetical protein